MSFARPSTADAQAPAGPDAIRLLRQAISGRQAGDRLAPVTVVVPSNYSALSLRRGLAAVPPGLVNVGFVVLGRLAELLGAPRLAASGRRPLPAAVLAHAMRQAVAADPGVFKEVAAHPATERALVRAYRDLRGLSPPAVRALARQSERSADVVRLVSAVRARLAPDWYDEQDLLDAAAQAVADGSTALVDTGHVIVFAPRLPAPAERAFIDALGDRATVIEASVDRGSAPPADELISAPDPDQEVRAVLRGIAARLADGTPLHRMAVFHPAAEPYALLLTQHLAAAGIPANGPPVRRLRELVEGTALLGLLRLPERNWHREDVMAWLSSAPVLDGAGRPVPASRWDTVSRAAGVVEGAEQWDERLGALAAAATEELRLLAEEGGGAEEDDAHRRRLERRIEDAQGLRRFLAEVVAAVEPRADVGRTWAAMSAWAGRLLERFLGGEAAHGGWPEPEQEGWRQVRAALNELASLDSVSAAGRPGHRGPERGEAVEPATFTRALDQQLDAPTARLGAFGDGVFVAPLAAARGTDFDVVFVVGLAEGTLPATAASTDGGGLLPLAEDGPDPIEQAHEDLLHALAAGRRRVLTWPRLDPRRGRERMPSRWLLAAAGPAVLSAADLDRLAASPRVGGPRVRTITSFAGGALALDDGALPLSLADYDLASLARWAAAGGQARDHFLAVELPRLAAGLEAAASRTGTRLTRFDGLVGADASAAAGLGAVMSPTSMEVYAACPMRYFLRQVLRLSAPDKPEEILRLRPLDKGSLVHAVLERYVLTLLEGQPRDLARLLAIAQEAFAEIEARGLTGKPLYWRYERELLLRELRRFHDEDRLTPIAAELAFGMNGTEPVAVALDDGRTLQFRGSADRVDVDPATGGLVVTDYKTGGLSDYEDLRKRLTDDPPDPVDRGRKLQLPLYALAAAARHPVDGPVRARYWFTSERGRFEEIGYPVDEAVLARLRQVLRVAADGVAAGAFPARPGEVDRATYKNCAYCDFDRLCPRDRARQWERKRTAPVLADYVALAEGQ
jgi:ATP-dependent helicase/nuclease subunit B